MTQPAQTPRGHINLWKDTGLSSGLELLRASCFEHRYPAHFHEEYVIAVISRGVQRHWVDKSMEMAPPGTVMVISPGEIHTCEAYQTDQGWDYCAFYPSTEFLQEIADEVIGGHGAIDFGREFQWHDPQLARQLLGASHILAHSDDVLERESATFESLSALIATRGERTTRGSRISAMRMDMRHAIEFLHAHYHQPLVARTIADTVGLSEYHFMRAFHQATGMTVHRYLTQIRLIRAKALLANGISAAETAAHVGFFDQSHLIKQFRTHFGLTPGAYAQACRR